jgi:surfeit locus 1 family protein
MVRLQQALVVLAGLVAAAIMVALGLWQMGVYQATGSRTAAERADGTPISILEAAPPGAKITDGLGRAVTFAGTYDPTLQERIPLQDTAGRFRVLTGIRLDDGRLLVVVRGITDDTAAPVPPTGRVEQVGVLLPSENASDPGTSVRVPLLAQHWPGSLVDGYVNLNPELSQAQGLAPATLTLPSAPGRLRNGAYALQWWLFAGFALVLAGRIVRDLDRGRDLELASVQDGVSDEAFDPEPLDTESLDIDPLDIGVPTTDAQQEQQRSRAT